MTSHPKMLPGVSATRSITRRRTVGLSDADQVRFLRQHSPPMTTTNARQRDPPPLRDTQRCDEPRRKNRHIRWRLENVVARRPQKGPQLESLSRRHHGRNENIAQRQPQTYREVCKRSQPPQNYRRQQRTDTAHLVRSQNSERDPNNRRRNVQSTREQNRDS